MITLRILGWEANGLRCPDHKINFERPGGEVANAVLLQMPNGTGKTTTLRLLRAALSGEASNWVKSDVLELMKSRGTHSSFGSFKLEMLLNGDRLTVTMKLDFDEGRVDYTTTHGDGRQDQFRPPQVLRRILKPEFVNFFVFDGELAGHLLDRRRTKAEGVIHDLFQLDLFEKLQKRLDEHWEELTCKKGATEERGLSRRRNRVQELRKRIAQVEQESSKADSELSQKKDELLRKENKFNDAIGNQRKYAERLQKATEDLERAKAAVEAEAGHLLNKMRLPHALSPKLAGEMAALITSLDRVKLPESTAREFFTELAEEAECVCGTVLDEETRARIRDRARRYLGTDEMNLLNSLKAEVKTHVGEQPEAARLEADDTVELLKGELRLRQQAKQDKEDVERDAVGDNPALEAAKTEIEQLRKRIIELDALVRRYEDRDDSRGDKETYGIAVLKRRFADAEKKFAEVMQTLELKERRDCISGVLSVAMEKAASGIKQEITRDTNTRIEQLLPHNRLRVKGIDRCLILEDPTDGKVQSEGSVGENLSVAYAFLSTLFNRSKEHELPFVVDSPAGSLDDRKRREVARLVPRLTGQFIAFVISTEQQDFVEPLEEALQERGGGAPLYLTLFREGMLPEVGPGVGTRSEDGRLVEGRDFFVNIREALQDKEANDAILP